METVGEKSSFGRLLKCISNLRRLFSVSSILWRLGFPGSRKLMAGGPQNDGLEKVTPLKITICWDLC